MTFTHSNGEKPYPPQKLWNGFQKDAFNIWKYLGKDESDQCPEPPPWLCFQEMDESEKDEKLTQLWEEFSEWLNHNKCSIEGKKIVRLPAPKKKLLTVDPNNPYANDVLNRKHVGELLTNLVSIQTEPFVLAIDGSWGSGKTAFLRMWQPELENKFEVIHFNAWENDFTADPLVALAAEVDERFKGKIDAKKFRNLFRIAERVALKVASFGMISTDDLEEGNLKQAEEQQIDDWFAFHRSQKELTRAFRKQLEEIAANTKGKKLVFLIDELDRCRPTYTIEFLERIKHLFMAPGVGFVMAMDRKQLGLSIQTVYGQIDTNAYLRRFIDLTYKLPPPSNKAFTRMLLLEQDIAHYLVGSRKLDANDIKVVLTELSSVLKFSLRDIEHIIRNIVLAIRSTTPEQILPLDILSVLACIKLYNEELYWGVCHERKSAWEVIQALPPIFRPEDFKTPQNPSYDSVKSRIFATLYYIDPSLQREEVPQEHCDDPLFGQTAKEVSMFIGMFERKYPMSNGSTIRRLAYEKLELTNTLF